MLNDVFIELPVNSTVKWLNPAPYWETDIGLCRIKPASETDFWRETYFGHTADNGHALLASFSGNVVISTEIIFSPQQDYDQAGLMIRLSDKNWIKFSLELEPDKTIKLGTTVTSQGVSDWSGEIIDDISMPITLIAEISSGACLLSMRYGDGLPNTVRITPFIAVKSGDMWAGIYAACPRQSGFVANFENTSMRVIK